MKLINVFLILTVLLLSSCSTGQGNPEVDYFVGREGITMKFLENAPKEDVYEDTQFSVAIKFNNKGAADVPAYLILPTGEVDFPAGFLRLSYDLFYVFQDENDDGSPDNNNNFVEMEVNLRGKSDFVPQGEESIKTISYLRTNSVLGQRQTPETQLYASLCYPYRTSLSTDVCIDSSTQERNLRTQACQARDLAFSAGQGAPVTITRIEVDMVPAGNMIRPSFVVHVDNTGKGTVLREFDPLAYDHELCSFQSTNRESLNTIFVSAFIAGVPLDCEPNPFRLVGDSSKFFCRMSLQDLEENPALFQRKGNFVTNLNIELYYAYSTSISKKIKIQRRVDFDNIFTETDVGCADWEISDGEYCSPRCGTTSETERWKCNCDKDKCVELSDKRRCQSLSDRSYCVTGIYCCLKTACGDLNSESSCANSNLDCSYCKKNNDCVNDCDDCGYEYNKEGSVCVEVEDET